MLNEASGVLTQFGSSSNWLMALLGCLLVVLCGVSIVLYRKSGGLTRALESTLQQNTLVESEKLRLQAALASSEEALAVSLAKEQSLALDIARFSERLEQSLDVKHQLQNSEALKSQALVELGDVKTLAARLRTALEAQKSAYGELKDQYQDLDMRFGQLQQQWTEKSEAYAELASRREAENIASQEKLKILEEARLQLKTEFQALANKIFDEKAAAFGQQSKTGVESLLIPLRDQLGDFKKRVEDVYDKEAKDRRALHEQIGYLKDLNQQMSEETLNLTRALKGDNKAQGNWGEVILEKVLEESGLRKGHEYEVQVSFNAEGNKRYQPDVVIRLPDQKDIVVDSKVSLVAYEAFMSSDDDSVRALALKEHCGSVRGHVKGLSHKEYQALEGLRSLDFVLLFIPIEGAFHLALEQDPTLFKDAFDQNIILVSPATLLVTLRTIHNIWRYEHQSQNSREIAKRGGELHDKFVGFIDAMSDIGKNLDRTQLSYETAFKRLSEGRGNLVSQVSLLKRLGANTHKQLNNDLLGTAQDSDFDED